MAIFNSFLYFYQAGYFPLTDSDQICSALIPVDHILVGGAITIFKNDGVRQWEGLSDYPIYYGKKSN